MLTVLFFAAQSAPTKPPLYPHLASEINQMTVVDQDIRDKFIAALSNKKPELAQVIKQMNDIDHQDTERMKWIVKEFGWPTPEMVGEEASENAWLLVQHADADHPFQKQCLRLIEPLAKKHIVKGADYAYLYDRVQTGDGKPQRFGTQCKVTEGVAFVDPVEDSAHVDAYRKAYDLPPLEDYLKMLADQWKAKIAPDWRERMKPPKSRN